MAISGDEIALRRLALAVTVLHDLDLEPFSGGVVLRDGPPVEIGWEELRGAVSAADPESRLARRLAVRHLRARRALADMPDEQLAQRARPVGFAVGSAYHPGPGWVRRRVHGNALDLGVGLVGAAGDPEEVLAVPQACFAAAGLDPSPWWPRAADYLDRMGILAWQRVRREPGAGLRPIGDCDVVTLLGSPALRAGISNRDGTGLAAVAVPMRRRGWLDLSRIDPAFTLAAAAATDEEVRGFERPLLVTADEVVLAPDGGRLASLALRDPAVGDPVLPDVRWR